MPEDTVKFWNSSLKLVSLVGLLVSIYSFYVEVKIEHDKNYVAMCDINEQMSCSKAFESEYGRGFGLLHYIFGEDSIFNQPNSLYGIATYFITFLLGCNNSVFSTKLLLQISILSNIMSLYLAYILIFILYDFCIVCVTTYVVNLALWFFSYKKYKQLVKSSGVSNGKKAN